MLFLLTGLQLDLTPKLEAKEISIEVVASQDLTPDHPPSAFPPPAIVFNVPVYRAFVTITVPGMATITGFTGEDGKLTVDLPDASTGLITVDKPGFQAVAAELPKGPDLRTTMLGDKVRVSLTRNVKDEEVKTDSPGTELPVEIWASEVAVTDEETATRLLETFNRTPLLFLYQDLSTEQNNLYTGGIEPEPTGFGFYAEGGQRSTWTTTADGNLLQLTPFLDSYYPALESTTWNGQGELASSSHDLLAGSLTDGVRSC